MRQKIVPLTPPTIEDGWYGIRTRCPAPATLRTVLYGALVCANGFARPVDYEALMGGTVHAQAASSNELGGHGLILRSGCGHVRSNLPGVLRSRRMHFRRSTDADALGVKECNLAVE